MKNIILPQIIFPQTLAVTPNDYRKAECLQKKIVRQTRFKYDGCKRQLVALDIEW